MIERKRVSIKVWVDVEVDGEWDEYDEITIIHDMSLPVQGSIQSTVDSLCQDSLDAIDEAFRQDAREVR